MGASFRVKKRLIKFLCHNPHFSCVFWRYQEIKVDSTRQDGPWTIHLKLDKTWHLDKILLKVS